MLILPIKTKWLDMEIDGIKLEEYREIKPYWAKRLEKVFADGRRHVVRFRAGYSCDSSYADFLCSLHRGTGREEWGAEKGKKYYVLSLLKMCAHMGGGSIGKQCGENIKNLRISCQLKQKELEQLLGYSDSVISAWETGRIAPSDAALEDLADFFSVSVDQLLHGEIPNTGTRRVRNEAR